MANFLMSFLEGSEYGERARARRIKAEREKELAQIFSPQRSQLDALATSTVSDRFSPSQEGVATPNKPASGLTALGGIQRQPQADDVFGRDNLRSARDKSLEWGDIKSAQEFQQALSQLDQQKYERAKATAQQFASTVAYIQSQPIERQGELIREHGPRFNLPADQIERYAQSPWLLGPIAAQNEEYMEAFAEGQKPFTLSDGQERYAADGQMIAENASDPVSVTAGSRLVDPSNGQTVAEGNTPSSLDPRVLAQNDRRLDLVEQGLVAKRRSNSNQRSLNVVPMQGPEGFTLGQATSDGNLAPVKIPEGYTAMNPYDRRFSEAAGGAMGKNAANANQRLDKWERQIHAFKGKSDLLKEDIRRAVDQSNRWNTGPIAGRNPFATNLEATLTTIRGNLGFDALQEMRDNSPTGGALGQVSNFEIQNLQSLQGNIERSQNEEQLDHNLNRLFAFLEGQEDRLRRAYEQDLQRGLIEPAGRGPLSYLGNGTGNQSSASEYLGGWNDALEQEMRQLEAELEGVK